MNPLGIEEIESLSAEETVQFDANNCDCMNIQNSSMISSEIDNDSSRTDNDVVLQEREEESMGDGPKTMQEQEDESTRDDNIETNETAEDTIPEREQEQLHAQVQEEICGEETRLEQEEELTTEDNIEDNNIENDETTEDQIHEQDQEKSHVQLQEEIRGEGTVLEQEEELTRDDNIKDNIKNNKTTKDQIHEREQEQSHVQLQEEIHGEGAEAVANAPVVERRRVTSLRIKARQLQQIFEQVDPRPEKNLNISAFGQPDNERRTKVGHPLRLIFLEQHNAEPLTARPELVSDKTPEEHFTMTTQPNSLNGSSEFSWQFGRTTPGNCTN